MRRQYICSRSKCADGSHSSFNNNENSDLKSFCLEIFGNIGKRRKDRFNISDTATSAVKEASSGLYREKNPFADAYELHAKREDAKACFKGERLAQGNEQIGVMESIGRSIDLMSHTDNNLHSLFIEYVELDFEPANRESDVHRFAKENQKDCMLLRRRVARFPARYVSTLENRCIKELVERWLIAENSHHH